MHFLGVAGMPRRIPGEQFVFISISNNYGKYFAKIDCPVLKLNFDNFNSRPLKMCKFMLSKGKLFS